jgi:hypothetical protein
MGPLNRFIKEQATEEVKDALIWLEKLDEKVIKLSQTVKANAISFGGPQAGSNNDLNKRLAESDKLIKQLTEDQKKNEQVIAKLTAAVEKYTAAKGKETQERRNSIIEAREERKEMDMNAVAHSNLTTYIAKLSVERLRASKTVADYNAMIQMGTQLTDAQTAELEQATAQFQKYDAAIKAGKKSIGDAREYVGHYERANMGLSNSIGQIARELPAMTFGFQTFALGVSNNIPMAVDEIKKLVSTNKELAAQGKQQVNIWKEVGNSLLSFNVIMSASILLFTMLAPQIQEWAESLFSANEAMEKTKKGQEALNKARLEGQKAQVSAVNAMKSDLAIAKDGRLSDDLRMISLKKLRTEYEYYFKDLTDAQILAGETAEAEKKITAALNARGEASKAQDQINANEQRLLEITDALVDSEKNINKARAERIALVKKSEDALGNEERSAASSLAVSKLRQVNGLEADRRMLIAEQGELNKQNIANADKILALQKESIGLDYKSEKNSQSDAAALKLRV